MLSPAHAAFALLLSGASIGDLAFEKLSVAVTNAVIGEIAAPVSDVPIG